MVLIPRGYAEVASGRETDFRLKFVSVIRNLHRSVLRLRAPGGAFSIMNASAARRKSSLRMGEGLVATWSRRAS